MKGKIKNINYWLPFFLLGSSLFALHLAADLSFGDDPFFQNAIRDNGSLVEFLAQRYCSRSSRILIEGALVLSLHFTTFVWRFLDTFMMLLIPVLISRIFIPIEKKELNWFICGMFFLYPYELYRSAGWAATTVNYIWPLAMALLAVMPIRLIVEKKWIFAEKQKQNKGKNFIGFVIYTMALLFAANQEQVVCALIIVYGFFLLYRFNFIIGQKPDETFCRPIVTKVLLLQFIVCLVSLAFIMTCPGNTIRIIQEAEIRMPGFGQFSVFHKLYLGITTTMACYFKYYDFASLVFCALLIVAALYTKKKWGKYIACIPFGFVFVLGFLKYVIIFWKYPSQFRIQLKSSYTMLAQTAATDSPIWFILYLMIIIVILLSLYSIFGGSIQFIYTVVILGCGFITRISLGFSPTLYDSGYRTALFCSFSLIIVALLLMLHSWKNCPLWLQRCMKIVFCFIVIFAFSRAIMSVSPLYEVLMGL